MSSLNPDDVQVILLEMQPEVVASARTVAPASLLRTTAILRQMCAALAIPITASIVPLSAELPQLVDELNGIEPMVRGTVSPFDDDAIRTRLHDLDRKVLAIGGVSSEIAVLHTAIGALRAGYAVHLLLDACGGLSERSERSAIRQMELAGATPSNVSSLFTGMIGDMSDDGGRAVMAALAQLWSWDTGGATGGEAPSGQQRA